LKAVLDIRDSSAENIGAFNTGFDTVNLHCPTGKQRAEQPHPAHHGLAYSLANVFQLTFFQSVELSLRYVQMHMQLRSGISQHACQVR
jgi:hypothetical protein